MRWTLSFLLSMVLCAAAWGGSTPNPADYPISVHVSASKVSPNGGLIRLKVVIDGKRYELEAMNNEAGLLLPGDYKAKNISLRIKDVHAYDLHAGYEFLFPDMKTRQYQVVGVWEK